MLLKSLWLLGLVGFVWSDTPANCTFEDIQGTWDFYETRRNGEADIDCKQRGLHTEERTTIHLTYPNSAKDEFGNLGTWTLIYNQGFEVTVNGRSYFAFSDYKVQPDGVTVESFCDRTQIGSGWSHDITVRNWACFHARKRDNQVFKSTPKIHYMKDSAPQAGMTYKYDAKVAKLINSVQKSWVAGRNIQFEGMKMSEIDNLKGGKNSKIYNRPSTKPVQNLLKSGPVEFIPESWDWRNVDGVNYVPEVRNQGKCGSCYAFASRGMLESRLKILTKNTMNVSLSPQDIMDCSPLSQGCSGGFPYLVAGRYGKDYGFVDEACNPYRQEDGTCNLDKKKHCTRHYTSSYSYVGGYYGACNEDEMKRALVKNGPMAVAFEVESDFMLYKSGVYHHTQVSNLLKSGVSDFDPFEMTNHAVLLVGYGYDEGLKEKFWIVQNSWGKDWGESGYFRIRRGTDECAIESIAVEAFPIP